MARLADLLGQDETADAVFNELLSPANRLVRITGPSGSGKTYVAFNVGAKWQEAGGRCVIALGDDHHAARTLHPLLSGLAAFPRDWRAVGSAASKPAVQLASTVIGVGGIGGSIFDLLTSALRQRTERMLRAYSTTERDIILDFTRLARSRRLLLIADNGHWWDESSLWLLGELLSDRLRAAIAQLDSMQVLLVDSAEEQRQTAPEAFARIAAACAERTWRTRRCRADQFSDVLRSLGLDSDLPDDVVHALFSATGGHLKLAAELVAYATQHDVSRLITSDDIDYFQTLVSTRLQALGAHRDDLATLLGRAAVIGLSFEEKELRCLATGLGVELTDLIDEAERGTFLRRSGGRIAFTHDVVRSAFLRGQGDSELRAHRKQFEECLSILRPGDYATRADVLIKAGEPGRGRELFAVAAVERLRRGDPPTRVLRDAEVAFPDDGDLHAFLSTMAAGYASVAAGDFKGPLGPLTAPVSTESPLMAAERNYLAALCWMEQQTAHGAAEARRILRSWERALRQEAEIALRFLLLLQQAQVLSELFDDARKTERTIERRLLARGRYDPDAVVMLQIQNRRSAALNAPEIAELRIQEAVSFFRRGTDDPGRDRVELFRALNNLAAIQIRLGKDRSALDNTQACERHVLDAPEGVPRLDVLANNAVLAGFRAGESSVEEAIDRQRVVVASADGGDDKFIHRCNLAGLLLLGRRDEESLQQLAELGEELQTGELTETYLVYYWSALDVAAAALVGDTGGAIRKHLAMEPFVRSLRWPAAAYVRRRHTLLSALLPSIGREADRVAADTTLLVRRPGEVGAAWPYYGRLVLLAELSFWSDS